MSTIKTGTTLTTAYQVEGDTTGALVIQTGSTPTTAVTISSAQVVTFAGATSHSGLATFTKGSSNGITIGDVATNSNSVLRMQGTSAGYNWQIANNLNIAGIEFTPSTATGGTTYTTPAVSVTSNGIGLGNTTPASGIGIKFPATQSASTDANTLDDYEEGSWTPTILGTVTNPTSQTFSGIATYVKVGRLVWVGLAGVFTHSGGSGDFYITGLPFTTSADGTTPSGTPALLRNVTWTGGYACTHLRANTPNIELWGVANGGNYTRVPLSGFNSSGWEIYMNTTYRSAS